MKFSLIAPCCNEAGNLPVFVDSVCRCFGAGEFECELVLVDDGSTDGTQAVIAQQMERCLAGGFPRMSFTVIELSRNFGKESALFAGLENATGDYIGFIDSDMQQDPQVAMEMLRELVADPTFDVVAAAQKQRRERYLLRVVKGLFYRCFNAMSETGIPADVSDFRVFTRQVADTLLSMRESFRFTKGLFSWVGFKTKVVPYEVHDRAAGKTKWSLRSLVSYAWNGVLAFSTWPLKVIMLLGVALALLSLVFLGLDLYGKVAHNDDISTTMILVYVVLMMGGIQMFVLGVLGEYMARGYIESKNRPIYVARSVVHRASTDVVRGDRGIGDAVERVICSLPSGSTYETKAAFAHDVVLPDGACREGASK